MKTLTMIRHADSGWDQHDIDDIDRPLSLKGRSDLLNMCEVLKNRGFNPDIVIASSALRTIRTAENISSAINYPETMIVLDNTLYLAEPDRIFEAIKNAGSSADWLACVGHNPGISLFVSRFLNSRIDNIPACGIVELQFDVHTWEFIERSNLKSSVFDYPDRHR